MILQAVLTVFLILTLALIRWCWVKPRQEMKFYETQLKKLKYNSKIQPYRLFYNGVFDPIVQGKKQGDPYKLYKEQYNDYGVVLSNVLNRPYLELVHVDFIRDFFSVDKHYDYPKIKTIMRPFKRLLGDGIGFSQGQAWKKKKNILNSIMNFDFLKSQIPNIAKVCDIALQNLEKRCLKKKEGRQTYIQCYLLDDLMAKIFSQVILTSFFGINENHYIEGEQACQFLDKVSLDLMTHQLQSVTTFFGDWFYDMQFRKIDKSINRREKVLKEWGMKVLKQKIKTIEKEMEQKGTKIQVDNIIKAILVYKKQHNLDDNDPLVGVDEIYSHFVGFFLGGTDTTSNYTNMMVINLAKYPQIQQKVRDQIAEFMKDDDYSFENLKNLKYIDALQKETTRTYGPGNALLVREVAKDNYVNGLAIKKGTLVTIVPFANHFSQKYFKNPFQFRPERWLNGQCDNLDPFVMIGFSAGARTCLGKHLALLQNKIALIKILKRYKKVTIPNPDFKLTYKFTQCPQQFHTRLYLEE